MVIEANRALDVKELPFLGGKCGGWETDNKQGKKNNSMPGQVYQWGEENEAREGGRGGCVG